MTALRIAILFFLGCAPLASNADEADAPQWVRTNLVWTNMVPTEPVPIVDTARIEAQIELGCTQSAIRFGDTASMRQQINAEPMAEEVRRALSFASIARDYETAASLIQTEASRDGLDTLHRHLLEHQLILTALQFGRLDEARGLLLRFGSEGNDLPPAVSSDRIFWSVIAASEQSPEAWAQEHLVRLDRAAELDPTSFQVLAWRVMGWLRAKPWEKDTSDCRSAVKAFSDRVLDLSAAGACPLMLGHLGYALDRSLAQTVPRAVPPETSAWRDYAFGILAVVVGDRAVHKQAMLDLGRSEHQRICTGAMRSDLAILQERYVDHAGE